LNVVTETNPITANLGRRHFLAVATGTLGASLLASAVPRLALAEDLPHLSTADDPTAKMLNYTEDASNAASPHQTGQNCANCSFFQGVGTGYGPCRLYAGKAVNAKGWCSGYAAKKT
jgi:High potential iron-sulfur protein